MLYQELDKSEYSMESKEIDDKEVELLQKAELLMELRGYQKESLHKYEEIIDIKASKPETDETVVMRIVTKSELKSGGVSVETVRKAEQIMENPNIDDVILFGKKFTKGARIELREEGVEFFSKNQRIVSTLNRQELYSRLVKCVDELCRVTCGHVPQSEDECKGYSKNRVTCSFCVRNGKLSKKNTSSREAKCPVCGGEGSNNRLYSCKVRLISDNADFHYEHGWVTPLQKDLLSLLKILYSLKDKEHTLSIISSSPSTI